jgi:hypothetical protein
MSIEGEVACAEVDAEDCFGSGTDLRDSGVECRLCSLPWSSRAKRLIRESGHSLRNVPSIMMVEVG